MKTRTFFIALFCILILLLLANIFWGSLSIPAEATWRILLGDRMEDHPSWRAIVWEGRVPQALTAALCGASLSTCGLLLQTLFRNPLAGPSNLGIDSGANLGVALVMLTGASFFSAGGGAFLPVVTAAMLGALFTMMLLLVMNRILRSDIMLLITGVIISSVTGSLIQLLNFSATEEGVHNFIVWGMGNFSAVSMDRLPLFCLLSVAGLLAASLLVKPLDTLLLGEMYATNLGTDVARNMVFVGEGESFPGLFRSCLRVLPEEIHWIRPDKALRTGGQMRAALRIRYRQPLQAATLYMRADGLYIVFDEPQRSITPGQFAAWYVKVGDGGQEFEMLGSGVIEK